MEEKPSRAFYYPPTATQESQRMCTAGQRRAVMEAWDFLVPGADIGVASTLTRAAIADYRLRHRANVSKYGLISLAVVRAYLNGTLSNFIDPTGNYILETYRGVIVPCNIFSDIESGKRVF